MGLFGIDFGGITDVFSTPFNAIKDIGGKAYDMVNNNMNRLNRVADAGTRVVDGAASAVEGIGSFLSGNSNILLYIGVIAVGIVIVPKLVDKFM